MESKFMMVGTGNVDSLQGWIESVLEDELTEECPTPLERVMQLVENGELVEVIPDGKGWWKEI